MRQNMRELGKQLRLIRELLRLCYKLQQTRDSKRTRQNGDESAERNDAQRESQSLAHPKTGQRHEDARLQLQKKPLQCACLNQAGQARELLEHLAI